MALTGQLSDMSLAELIEFFCNQRKTGRLKIDYPRGHSVFFIKEGELVDARVGALSGVEAVYFSLTLPNAAFDFSPDVHPSGRTINDTWTQVVLEGLRRLDEGLSPTEADAFGNFSPTDAEMVAMFDQVERLGDAKSPKQTAERSAGPGAAAAETEPEMETAPLSMMVESANGDGGGRKRWMVMGVAAAVVLVCAVAAIPLSGAFGSKDSGEAAPAAVVAPEPAPAAPADAAAAAPAPAAAAPEATVAPTTPEAEAAEAARRERERRERREREERERRERAQNSAAGEAVVPKPAAPSSGPKSVRVSVSYDEQGRVTQASVAGASPGAEAYGATAVRIARGRRFPAGKAGSTVVTIPVN